MVVMFIVATVGPKGRKQLGADVVVLIVVVVPREVGKKANFRYVNMRIPRV